MPRRRPTRSDTTASRITTDATSSVDANGVMASTTSPIVSWPLGSREKPVGADPGGASWARRRRRGGGREVGMADVAYLLVIVGGFVLLAMTLRGLERL